MGTQLTNPQPYAELDITLPIVMLPVRLETRYFAVDAENVELRVRIYPSAAHITTNRPTVDQTERDETVAYWTTRKSTGDASAETSTAWQHLTALFGLPRALWLRRILTPAADSAGALTFPTVPITPAPSDSAVLTSEATALPSRFFVAAYAGAARQAIVTGLKIATSITAGPHNDAKAIAWQSDFASAEAIGLAVRMFLPRTTAASLTRILVYGVREGADAATSATVLSDLLDRHIRGDGVALLRPGIPTNNTADGRTPAPPLPPEAAPEPGSDGYRLALALGLDPASFAAIGGSEIASDLLTVAMHIAVWPAAPGYFIEQAMSPAFDAHAILRGQTLYHSYVRPGGPYSTVLIGSQPYGVLPVTVSAQWQTAAGTPDLVMNAFRALSSTWLAAAENIPRLGAGADAGAELAAILSQSPNSCRWIGRHVEASAIAGRNFQSGDAAHYQLAVNAIRQKRVQTELTPVGVTAAPLALGFVFSDGSFNLRAPLVAPDGDDPNASLAANYIDAMRTATVDALKNNIVTGASPRSLLYILLRQATLAVIAKTADQALDKPPLQDAAFVSDTDTVWMRVAAPVAALNSHSVSDVVGGAVVASPLLQLLRMHRLALGTLASAHVSDLERATAEAMDAASHRLDAWFTALATERLSAMRTAKAQGLHLGAYAWIDAPPLPESFPDLSGAPVTDPNSEGFIHAPSLDHARTGAVLRSAFLSRQGEAAQAPLAIDLSSDRVRMARHLLAEIQGGAALSVALAARIERAMVDAGLGPQLPALRDAFPLDSADDRKRIDGLALAQSWHTTPPAPPLLAVANVITSLLDAVGDLLFAEAVHRSVTGNPSRAQLALGALETGAAAPDEFGVLRTTSEETSISWRVILPFAGAELDKWIAQIIGDPSQLFATVMSSGQPPAKLSVASLGLAAKDLLGFVQNGPDAPALQMRFSAAGNGPAAFSPALETALAAAYAISLLLLGARALSADDLGAAPAPLVNFAHSSDRKQWLHDLARFRQPVQALDILDSVARIRGAPLDLRFASAGPHLNIVTIGAAPTDPAAATLVDGWNETTPGVETVAGLAMHYDAPRSRPPQAILVVVPPNEKEGWDTGTVEAALLETIDLARMRMVRPADVHGSFLPALYFPENLQGDSVSTNFHEIAYVTELKE
jgi:hypothetical protein